MSKGQIRRKHGERTAAAPAGRGTADPAEAESPRAESARTEVPAQDAARPARGSSAGLVTGVVVVIGGLMLLYVLAWTLPQLGAAAGTLLPELRPLGFGREEAASAAAALGDAGLEQYRYVHRTSGLFAPMLLALGWLGMIALSFPRGARRWLMWAVPMLFAATYLFGNRAVDAALADPEGGPVALASALVVARWALLLALVVQAVFLLVRLVRRKVDAFARGELV